MIRLSKIEGRWSGGTQAPDLQKMTDLINEMYDEINRLAGKAGGQGSVIVVGLNVNGVPGFLDAIGAIRTAAPNTVDPSDL